MIYHRDIEVLRYRECFAEELSLLLLLTYLQSLCRATDLNIRTKPPGVSCSKHHQTNPGLGANFISIVQPENRNFYWENHSPSQSLPLPLTVSHSLSHSLTVPLKVPLSPSQSLAVPHSPSQSSSQSSQSLSVPLTVHLTPTHSLLHTHSQLTGTIRGLKSQKIKYLETLFYCVCQNPYTSYFIFLKFGIKRSSGFKITSNSVNPPSLELL